MTKEYFANYYLHRSDITFDFSHKNTVWVHHNDAEPWKITPVDTVLQTMTGGRVKRIRKYIGEDSFMLTYGGGVSDIDTAKLVKFHESHHKIAATTAINVGQKFGVLDIDDKGTIKAFREKSNSGGDRINGGFMVLNREIFDYIRDDSTVFGREPLERLGGSG